MSQPRIGITPDRSDPRENIESHFFVRRNYCDAVADGGGVPLVLPYRVELIDAYLDQLDGIVLTGGMFDIDPALYGMGPADPSAMALKEDRTGFERAILRGALARDLPLLGICGGMQLIAVEMGAQLFQHLPADVGTRIEHKQSAPCKLGAHAVNLVDGSRLRRIFGVGRCEVNSLHHQAVMAGNAMLRVAAVADDGVVEAVEVDGQAFCVGVQWHPEYRVNACEANLFAALVRAAGEQMALRSER